MVITLVWLVEIFSWRGILLVLRMLGVPQFQGRESKRVSQRLWCHAPAIRKVHSFLHFFFFWCAQWTAYYGDRKLWGLWSAQGCKLFLGGIHKQELARRTNAVQTACGDTEEAGWPNVKLLGFTHNTELERLLCKTTVQLSEHNPDRQEEMKQINAAQNKLVPWWTVCAPFCKPRACLRKPEFVWNKGFIFFWGGLFPSAKQPYLCVPAERVGLRCLQAVELTHICTGDC